MPLAPRCSTLILQRPISAAEQLSNRHPHMKYLYVVADNLEVFIHVPPIVEAPYTGAREKNNGNTVEENNNLIQGMLFVSKVRRSQFKAQNLPCRFEMYCQLTIGGISFMTAHVF